jgi:hypothetical protein
MKPACVWALENTSSYQAGGASSATDHEMFLHSVVFMLLWTMV